MLERLALGTVQFGLDYGIANRTGQTSREEAARIIVLARTSGLDTLDTGIGYGESETCLGDVGVADWRVITKLPALAASVPDVSAWVQDSVGASLGRLRLRSVGGLLVHRAADLIGRHGAALIDALRRERDEGRAAKIGMSVYDPAELDATWRSFTPDIVQAPVSAIDRRLEESGWLNRLHDSGVEIHARSALLQGLLTMSEFERPKKFDRWAAVWAGWSSWVASSQLHAAGAAVGHVLSYPEISRVVVGVDAAWQLEAIITSVACGVVRAPASLVTDDRDLLEPFRWSSL